jgi:hypothetical protein
MGIRVIKAGEANTGSTAGLRFNPRAAPEFVEEERNLGRDDPESKQTYDEKKRGATEKRQKAMAGLQHLKIRVQDMRDEGEFDSQEGSTELSDLTGPASSTGSPLDVAVGAKTGTGSSMSDGGGGIGREVNSFGFFRSEVAVVSDILKETETLEDKPKRRNRERRKDETLETVVARQAGEKSAKRRQGMDATTETFKQRQSRKEGRPLRTHTGRNPSKYTTVVGRTKELVGDTADSQGPRLTGKRYKGEGGSKNPPFIAMPDPREKQSRAARRVVEQSQPTQPATPPAAFQTGHVASREVRQEAGQKPTKQNTAHKGPPKIRAPPQTKTPMGAKFGRQGMGEKHKSSPFADSILASEDVGKARGKLSSADVTEFKWVLREMRDLLRQRMRKSAMEDAEHDDARPTPNAHRKTTSSNHGWNDEPDPDDDPRYWGSHPYGLLTGRRGHG